MSPRQSPEDAGEPPIVLSTDDAETPIGGARSSFAAGELPRIDIPGYKLSRKIGQGGMGAVYLARQISMDRNVALKILPPSLAEKPGFKERFFREARAAGRLSHPNIVAAIDCQETGGICFLAMEYVDGEELSRKIKRDGPMWERAAFGLARQIAEALAHAWKAGIVHRDVKPENFLITSGGVAKLCDLGIARMGEEISLSDHGQAIGTPRYMSPEQARGHADIDWRSDMYSLGASLYYIISGAPPFTGANSREVMQKHVDAPRPLLSEAVQGASAGATAVIAKMMAKSPARRYDSPESLIRDLTAVENGGKPEAALAPARANATQAVAPVEEAPAESVERGWPALLPFALGGLILVAFLAWFMLSGDAPDGDAPPEAKREVPEKPPLAPKQSAELAARAAEHEAAGRLDEALRDYGEVAERSLDIDLAKRAKETVERLTAEKRARDADAELAGLLAEAAPEPGYVERLRGFIRRYEGTAAAARAAETEAELSAEIQGADAQRRLVEVKNQALRASSPLPWREAFRNVADTYPGTEAGREALRQARQIGRNGQLARLPLATVDEPDRARKVGEYLAAIGGAARRRAADALRDLSDQGPFPPEVTEAVRKALAAPAAEVRAAALEAAWGLDDFAEARAFWLAALDDRNEAVRRQAVVLLGDAELKDCAEQVARLAAPEHEPSPAVRRAAADAAAKLAPAADAAK